MLQDTDILVNFKHFKNDTETMQCEKLSFSVQCETSKVLPEATRAYIHFNAYL